jgi:peptidoglycan/LPS O-acetylase OafA/YrhL
MMQSLYLSHFDSQNQIGSLYATYSLSIIITIIILLILVSIRKKNLSLIRDNVFDNCLDMQTAITLRGIAVLFLIFGHFAVKCVEGVLPFSFAARWAVIIFLFLSGVGLTKKYGLSGLNSKFIISRIRRLLIPLWITLILFYTLNYFLLGWSKEPVKIIINFAGILFPWQPNDPAWFITYIIYLYILYCVASFVKTRDSIKPAIIMFLSYITMFCIIHSSLLGYFGIWIEYTCVFSVSVLVGVYRNELFHYMKSFYDSSIFVYFIILLSSALVFMYYDGTNNMYLKMLEVNSFMQVVKTVQLLLFIIPLLMLACCLDHSKYESRLLSYLGDYSYEIYLLHMPFMVFYDFFLFRRPLAIYFFVYILYIAALAKGLRLASEYFKKKLFCIA